jgi:hypothetical protein
MITIKLPNFKILVLAGLFTLASCEDELDLQPISEIGTGTFYKTPEEVDLAVIAIYSSLQKIENGEWLVTELRSDNTYMNPNSTETKDLPMRELDRHVAQSQNIYVQDYWRACYTTINLANIVMQNLEVVTDETLRNTLEGEARFLRAHAYFNLVRLWGGVFLIDHTVSGAEAKKLDRSPQSEVYEFIINDFRQAAILLPATQTGVKLGRVTQDAAKTLLGKALLTRKGAGDIAEAREVLTDVVSGSHSLLSSYASVFDIGNEYNNEVLFAVRYQSGGLGLGSPFPNFFAPLQSDNYVVFGNGDGRNVPTESITESYPDNDPRKAASMAEQWTGFQSKVNDDRHIVKYNSAFSNVDDSGNDWIVTRYADALLLLAEAINEQSGPNDEALGYLNRVRTRALGAAGALNIGDVSTYFNFKLALENERRLEFGFENHRWFDLVRTNRAETVMTQHFSTEFQYNDPDHPAFAVAALQHYQIFLPIPQYEIDINPKIAQNTGY